MRPVGITRVRNESLIIADTIDHFLNHCDHIILYDDCSDDRTADIAQEVGGDRIQVIRGLTWDLDRLEEETRHRSLLLEMVRDSGSEWCLCFDADERLVGSLPDHPPQICSGYRFRLFDGYLTPHNQDNYSHGALEFLPRLWGPEYRDILMMFRVARSKYIGSDKREPNTDGEIILADVKVKHFGKCLSVDHWEETCDYYVEHFPPRFKRKWAERKGKAIHVVSDFGRDLFSWRELMINENKWVKL